MRTILSLFAEFDVRFDHVLLTANKQVSTVNVHGIMTIPILDTI